MTIFDWMNQHWMLSWFVIVVLTLAVANRIAFTRKS